MQRNPSQASIDAQASAATRDLDAELCKARLLSRLRRQELDRGPLLGRFELRRCLGRGGMGSVFEARDLEHGGELALKVLHVTDERALAGLTREFRSHTNVAHPNLVTTGELHADELPPFFTMELVPGISLRSIIARGESVDATFAHNCLAQLLDVLAVIHARGTLHGDIKPSNLILRPDGRLILVDFGIARALRDQRPWNGSGTPAYMAPELLNPDTPGSGSGGGPQSDWFAVGAVLRDLLAAAQRCGTPSRALQALRQLSTGLLAPDPSKRLGADDVARSLSRSPRLPAMFAPEDQVFIGRRKELDALLSVCADHSSPEPRVCSVSAAPGLGKTALMERLAEQLANRGALVLSGRCYEQEVARYKGFDGVVGELAAFVLSLPRETRRSLRVDTWSALHQVFAGLATGGMAAPSQLSSRGDPRRVRTEAYAALSALLRAIATERPIVVLLDDLQWGDADGASLLEYLLLGPEPPPVAWVANHRSGEEGPCLSVLRKARAQCPHLELTLGPLPHAEATRLVRALSGGMSPAFLEALVLDAGGSPLLLRALLLRRGRGGSSPPDFHTLVTDSLAQLDAESRELLVLAVLAGQPIELELLARAAGAQDHPWRQLALLRGLGLLRSVRRELGSVLTPHHDRVREAVLSVLQPEEQRRGHAAIARTAEQLGTFGPDFLSEHYLRAGELGPAARYAEQAGDLAREGVGLQRARTLYGRALDCLAPERPPALVAKLADAAALLGDVNSAAPLFLEAASGLPETSHSLRMRAAEMFLLRGAPADGLRLLRPALRRWALWLPSSNLGATVLGAVSLARAEFARRLRRRDYAEARDEGAEAVFKPGYLLSLTMATHGTALLLWSGARSLRRGSKAQYGRGLAQLAYVYSVLGLGGAAHQDAMLDEAQRLTMSDPMAHAVVLINRAVVAAVRADYRRSVIYFTQAQRFIVEPRFPGDWVLLPLRALTASVHVLAGHIAQLTTAAPELEREARAVGNPAMDAQIGNAHAWTRLAAGDHEAMGRYTHGAMEEWRAKRVSPLYVIAVWGECHRLLYLGEVAAAYALKRAEARRFARSGVGRSVLSSGTLLYLWGCIELSHSARPGDRAWRQAVALAKRLRGLPSLLAEPAAAILEAGMLRRRGERDQAVNAYERARHGFDVAGMEGHMAVADFRLAELRQTSESPADASPWFAAHRIAEPARWARMLAP
ncbi:MAG: AAA family ATPase [Myxococcales bacterium]|nr:AAA family ATPase [Myxococcales bacterium]